MSSQIGDQVSGESDETSKGEADAKAIRIILAGNREKFAYLVHKYQAFAIGLAYSMVGNEELAREMAQESFVKAYENLGKLQDLTKFHSWLYGVVRNTCLAWLKKNNRSRSVSLDLLSENSGAIFDSGVLAADDQMMAEQRKSAIWAAINQLPEKYKSVIVLFHFHSKSYEEIGQILGLEHKGVDSRLRRARLMLKERLKEVFNE